LTSYDRNSLPNGVDTPRDFCYTRPKSGAPAPLSKGFKMNAITATKVSDINLGDLVQCYGEIAEIDFIHIDNDFGHIRYIIGMNCQGEDFTADFLPNQTLNKVGA
jgi:hypothetical protein